MTSSINPLPLAPKQDQQKLHQEFAQKRNNSSGFRYHHDGAKHHVDVSASWLKDVSLPLSNHLVKKVWNESENDSTPKALAKTVARGLTHFFSAVTVAPLYQGLLHLPMLFVAGNKLHSDYAKSILESYDRYNSMRKQVATEGDLLVNYLDLDNLQDIQDLVHDNKPLMIDIPTQSQGFVNQCLSALLQGRDNIHSIMVKEADSIALYLESLPHKERVEAHKEILGSIVTHVGFDHTFRSKEDRASLAITVSNIVASKLLELDVAKLLNDLDTDHNFIKLQENLEELTENFSEVFGLSHEHAFTFVAQSLKADILSRHGSVENFVSHHRCHLEDLCSTANEEYQVLLEAVRNEYVSAVEKVSEEMEKVRGNALTADAKRILGKLHNEVATLRLRHCQLQEDLHIVNEQLVVKGKRSRFSRIKYYASSLATLVTTLNEPHIRSCGNFVHRVSLKPVRELLEEKREKEDAIRKALDDIKAQITEISRIHPGNNVNVNTSTVKALQKDVDEKINLERQFKEYQANLDIHNKRAFRACLALVSGVNDAPWDLPERESKVKAPSMFEAYVSKPAKGAFKYAKALVVTPNTLENQSMKLMKVEAQIQDPQNKFKTRLERLKEFAFGESYKRVSQKETVQEIVNDFSPASEVSREAVRGLYENNLSQDQRESFEQGVEDEAHLHSLNVSGHDYLQAYFDGKVAVIVDTSSHTGTQSSAKYVEVLIDPTAVQKVLNRLGN